MEKDIKTDGALAPSLPSWQERLVAERAQLLEHTVNLRKTLDDKNDFKLTNREWQMLQYQFGAMREYLQALTDRCVYYDLIEAGDLGIHY